LYYHHRELKYVEYDKIFPPPEKVCDKDFIHAYRWLGHYCGYCPQVWLSQCDICMTGFGGEYVLRNDSVLFGFDWIKGFPIDYDLWHFVLSLAPMRPDLPAPELSKLIFKNVVSIDKEYEQEGWGDHEPYAGRTTTVEEFLEKRMFVSDDHFVLPNLNLKSAKKIVCRNEKQKKKLRRKGFIEDRIKIMNVSHYK